ncbi:hypothetical protein Dcar01_01092 [Deinococcus carri]|uniref:Uncharacterized protein n=1 Tax=Deinococcus carri TaxID=1211323 RepID=A0ABP9W8P9_9DEIO
MNVPKLNLAGHPLHTILNDAPLTLLPFSLTLDVMSASTDRPSYRDDLMDARYRRIEQSPALTLRRGDRGVVLFGYRPYAALLEALRQVAPDLPRRPVGDAEAYKAAWGGVLPRELAEALGDARQAAAG